MSDKATLAWIAYGWDGFVNHWMWFRLSDGTTDSVMYPSKTDAMQHTLNEKHCLFAKMHPGGMSECEAEILLSLHRKARARDIATPDLQLAKGGPDLIPRIGYDKIFNQIRALKGGS